MGIVLDALAHVAAGVGNIIGTAIRLGHGEVSRHHDPRPTVETATPVRGIPIVGLRR
jgi:hypothetical protein